MSIPQDNEGRFEAVDGDGAVVGEGEVAGGTVMFRYGDRDPEGAFPYVLVLPATEFEAAWGSLPQAQYLTLREAGG